MKLEYPYLPEGREIHYVGSDNKFMIQAKALQSHGDPLFPVGGVLVKDGVVIGKGANGFNKGPGQDPHICPRVVLECPSGEGYDLCSLHDAEGHCERMVLKDAYESGCDPNGADLYMYGHWWACKPCWDALIDAGANKVFLVDDAHNLFTRDKVQASAFIPSVKRAYIAGALSNLEEDAGSQYQMYEGIGEICEDLGIHARIPHIHNGENKKENHEKDPRQVFEWGSNEVAEADVIIAEVSYPSLGTGSEIMYAWQLKKPVVLLSRRGQYVSKFVTGNPAVVYHAEYGSVEEVQKVARNILKQL